MNGFCCSTHHAPRNAILYRADQQTRVQRTVVSLIDTTLPVDLSDEGRASLSKTALPDPTPHRL